VLDDTYKPHGQRYHEFQADMARKSDGALKRRARYVLPHEKERCKHASVP